MADYRSVDAKRGAAGTPKALTEAQKTAAAIIGDIVNKLDPRVLAELHDAMLSQDPNEGRTVARRAIMAGVRSEDIADLYIPTLARGYGDLWCEDELTFAEVTIAVSRLQKVLRELEADWPSVNELKHTQATLLLILPQDVFHTLGAFVLCGQLRRKGISVKMVLGGTSKSVADELRGSAFDAIFVSASQCDTLESLRNIIDAVRAATETVPPIVVGGPILEVETAYTVKTETGADYATGQTEEALDYCGLLTTQDDAPTKHRG